MVAIDTNIISLFLRGSGSLPADDIYLPYMVLAETRAGIISGSNPTKFLPVLEDFLQERQIVTSPGLTPDMVPIYTEIYSYLRSHGTPISPNDLWIAAECSHLSLPLLTNDKDFQNVPQVMLY